jgi:Carbohydrate esterase, sialic acid-specific acetylesterase
VAAPPPEPLDHPNFPFNAGRVGPGLAFARAYLTDLPSQRGVLLVPAAQGGSGLSDNRWNPGNDLYEQAVSRTLAALALEPGNCLAGILWSQGEIDAINRVPEAGYRTALHTMIRTMRGQLARGGSADAIPFVLSQFSNDWVGPTPNADQKAILDVINGTPSLLPATAVVSTAGLTSNLTQGLDGAIHLDAASQRIFGPRFREALKVAVANGPR